MRKIKSFGLLFLCVFAVCFGAGCYVLENIGGRTDKYEITPSDKNTVGLRYDEENHSFAWKNQSGVDSYDLYLENLEGDEFIVARSQVKNMAVENGELSFLCEI